MNPIPRPCTQSGMQRVRKHTALGRMEMNEVDARRESASKQFSDCMNYLTVNIYTPGHALFSYLSNFESRLCDMLGHLC